MKKLISASEIRELASKGEVVLRVDDNTLITPSARDCAAESGIKILTGTDSLAASSRSSSMNSAFVDEPSSDQVAMITRLVMAVLEKQGNSCSHTFVKECDPGGLRLIRGGTVTCSPFDTGDPTAVVGLTDIVNTRESPNMGAGFMTVEKSGFDWVLNYEEFDVILEGSLEVTVNGVTYCGKAGDVFFIPKGSHIRWSSPDRARFFYVTYPANWAGQ